MGIFIPLFPLGVNNLFCGGCKDEGKISTVLNSGDSSRTFQHYLKTLSIWIFLFRILFTEINLLRLIKFSWRFILPTTLHNYF